MAFDALNQQTQTTNQVNLLVDEVKTLPYNFRKLDNTYFLIKLTIVRSLLIRVAMSRLAYLGTRNERKTKVGTKPCNYDSV